MINMTWGKIYCQSWWGNEGEYERLIASGALPSPPAPICIGPQIAEYIERVETDGGVVEATDCIAVGFPDWAKDKAVGILPSSGYKPTVVYGAVLDNDLTIGLLKTAFDFTSARNGVANRINSEGVLEEMGNDVCRVEYPSCPSLLLEPASTNLFLNSDVGVSQIIAGLSIGGTYTLTFYEGDGSIDVSSVSGGPAYVGVPFTFDATSNNHNFTVTGTCNKVQLELGGYATSYIKTSGTTVTRPQDTLVQAVPNSDMYNSEEGVFMVDIAALADGGVFRRISVNDGTSTNRLYIGFSLVSNTFQCSFTVGGSNIFYTTHSENQLAYQKIALRYKENNFSLWFNGVNVSEQLSGSVLPANTLSQIEFTAGGSQQYFFGKCKQVSYFPSFLSDTEMAQLTT